jgi:excisionase family DNA binding protein
MSKLQEAALLDREAVAKIVGCHPETITRASRSGKLPAIYLGHRLVRYKRENVDAWLESFRHQAPPTSRKRSQAPPAS